MYQPARRAIHALNQPVKHVVIHVVLAVLVPVILLIHMVVGTNRWEWRQVHLVPFILFFICQFSV